MRYEDFLASKAVSAPRRGMENVPRLESHLRAFQADCVAFNLELGSSGDYLDPGLGKTAIGLSWAAHAMEAADKPALILTPLAVARQFEREGLRWGYPIRVMRQQSDARRGLNVTNYERLDAINPDAFGPVVFDESSIVKSYAGKTSRALISAFAEHRWKLALSATPAPNDHTELSQQSDLLGVMSRDEMLVRWFINDSGDTKSWRLKGHAVEPFFDWMASWSRMAEHPRDLGDDAPGYDLPALKIHRHQAKEPDSPISGGLFGAEQLSATTLHDVKRQTAEARAAVVARLVHADREPWVLWIDTDYEGQALLTALGDVAGGLVEVRGSMSIDQKERNLLAFADGTARVIIGKPSACGYGLNWQHCDRMAFIGRSFSYELWFQAVRRCWRFGQLRDVHVHLVVAEGEDAIGRVVDHKAAEHVRMKFAMVAAMLRNRGRSASRRNAYVPTCAGRLPGWLSEVS